MDIKAKKLPKMNKIVNISVRDNRKIDFIKIFNICEELPQDLIYLASYLKKAFKKKTCSQIQNFDQFMGHNLSNLVRMYMFFGP